VLPKAEALARGHVAYGVTDSHYDSVGAALLWTLRQGLGAAFDAPTEEAWTEAYALLSSVMLRAAHTAPDASD